MDKDEKIDINKKPGFAGLFQEKVLNKVNTD